MPMELSDLLEYAKNTYHIEEEHKWADWPGFSVLSHPDTGKWIALCMRQWDSETGELIERVDLKCEQNSLREFRAPWLTLPLRMKGYHWVGIAFTHETSAAIVRTLFDRAITYGKPRGYTVVLDQNTGPSEPAHRDTALPFSGSSYRPDKVNVPIEITQMRKMNSTLGDLKSVRNKTFYKQAVFMKDYEDDYPWQGDFFHYFSTYRDLNTPQLRGYFSWRTKIRKGIYEPIPLSAAYIYVYELLNGIGAASDEDRLAKIRDFVNQTTKAGIFQTSDFRTVEDWIPALGILLGLRPEVIAKYAEDSFLKRDAVLEKLMKPREYSDEDILEALKFVAGKKLDKSPVLSHERGAFLFAEAWRIGTETTFDSGNTLFALCFGARGTTRWYPLINAVYYEEHAPKDQDYVLNSMHSLHCRNGIWTQESYDARKEQKSLLAAFLHEADCKFRRYLKTGRYLQEKEADAWALPIINAAIQADRKAVLEASRPKITIDLSGLEKIRSDALKTQNSLLTETETMPDLPMEAPHAEEPDVTDEAELNTALPLDPVYVKILRKLLKDEPVQDIIREQHLMPALIADTVNELFYDEIGDTVLLCEDDRLAVVDDYREDIKQLIGGTK